MNAKIVRNGPVQPEEIADLRQAVGWDRSADTYERSLPKHYTQYTVRDADQPLIGYISVLSDGVFDSFLIDLAVHPEYQKTGLASQIVRQAIRNLKEEGIRCVQVTFDEDFEPFYTSVGHSFRFWLCFFERLETQSQ